MSNLVSQKCYYGLKAMFHLARHERQAPIKIGTIAERQNIPIRFLEAILRQLRQAGFVDSRRGSDGGYLLARRPSQIKVQDIIEFFEGDIVQYPGAGENGLTPQNEVDLTLALVWGEARGAMQGVFGNWSLQDLVDKAEAQREYVANFTI
ncbi:Rrf2 family transcriptional regulator [bacterium]|nr:Rrf2 family transcriptional regulator [bacterium]